MKINGYEINFTEEELDKKLNTETLNVELISQNFDGYKTLADGDKTALKHLVNAARIVNDISLEQDHPLNQIQKKSLEDEAKINTHAAKALRLFNSLNGVAGTNGLDKEPVQIFKGIKFLAGKNFYPADLNVYEFHNILIKMLNDGKTKEVQNILSARTIVRKKGSELEGIDFTEYFKKEFKLVADELEDAAKAVTNKDFKEYLNIQAKALTHNDNNLDMKADIAWADLQDTPLEFTLSRENYDDALTPTVYDNQELMKLLKNHNIEIDSKDTLGARVGIINKKGTDLILKFKNHMQKLAKLMPLNDRYEQSIGGSDLKQTMVDVDLVSLKGDYAQCRGGMTVAQNLPNNDKLSVKNGGGRRNVYHRQVRQSTDKEKTKKILDALVDKNLHKYYDEEADHIFVIGHENGHSLGPNSTYQSALGIYKAVIEELKADVISLAFMPEYQKTGVISEEELKKIYLTVSGRLFLKAEPQLVTPHRIADLIIFNYLLENKALSFDANKKMSVDFNNIAKVCYNLLEEVIRLQLSKSPEQAKAFIDKYTRWTDISEYIASIIKSFGVKLYKEIQAHF